MNDVLWPELAALYATPPDLSTCPLYYVHVDERDTSVTLGFETGRLPDHPRPEWEEKPYNTLLFFVMFTGVDELRVTGIAAEHPDRRDRTVRVTRTGSGRQQVAVTSDNRTLAFSAAASAVIRSRVYLQGPI
ncbi:MULTISPECIES: Imm50 family immunity protein [unclassified Streptomyces]|uniref:Imm50 family immunity protein n=1 Tax=unclassified Streptomyces TaxID=2593676 RepID=UPI002DDA7B25|nr:Imm50 family immunity protein [Streptomyces sp. NBC_01294]WRZ58210.1 immunity 50 family protein [Streptomyces sp. NBC_01294]